MGAGREVAGCRNTGRDKTYRQIELVFDIEPAVVFQDVVGVIVVVVSHLDTSRGWDGSSKGGVGTKRRTFALLDGCVAGSNRGELAGRCCQPGVEGAPNHVDVGRFDAVTRERQHNPRVTGGNSWGGVWVKEVGKVGSVG